MIGDNSPLFKVENIVKMNDQSKEFISPEQLINHLRWRYAVKKFDPTQKVSDKDWQALLESLVLTPSSFGLQPWKFFIIETPDLRQKLLEHSWNQAQVIDSSHLLVLARKIEITTEYIDQYVAYTAEVRGISAESLEGFGKVIKGFLGQMSPDDLKAWAKLQVYIALGQLMSSAAHLGIDTCPMEGFVPEKYDEILGLNEKGYAAAVVCPVGYRAEDDPYATYPKVRFKAEDVIESL